MASIQRRGKDSWLLVVEAGYNNKGERIKRTKTVKGIGKRDAEKELAKFQTEVEAGEYIAPNKMTFASFVEQWQDNFAKERYSPLTLKTYQHHLNNHIIPVIGHLHLDQIKTMNLVAMMNELKKPEARKDGRGGTLSGRTREYIYDVMQSVFNKAQGWNLIKENPLKGVDRPEVVKVEQRFYEESEAREVIAALYMEQRKWRLYCLGAMIGGFRRGELLALEWTDIDFEKQIIRIDESISLTENGKAIIGDPKKGSKGEVDMPTWFMEELKEHYHEWKVNRIKVGDKWQGEDRHYVFHGGLGKPHYHTYPTVWWKTFIKRHGLKYIRLHDLRHTSATLLIEEGVSLKAIQKRLRHSQFSTTADLYAHVTKKLSQDTAEKFDKFDPRGTVKNFVNNPSTIG
jgi:integrase